MDYQDTDRQLKGRSEREEYGERERRGERERELICHIKLSTEYNRK